MPISHLNHMNHFLPLSFFASMFLPIETMFRDIPPVVDHSEHAENHVAVVINSVESSARAAYKLAPRSPPA